MFLLLLIFRFHSSYHIRRFVSAGASFFVVGIWSLRFCLCSMRVRLHFSCSLDMLCIWFVCVWVCVYLSVGGRACVRACVRIMYAFYNILQKCRCVYVYMDERTRTWTHIEINFFPNKLNNILLWANEIAITRSKRWWKWSICVRMRGCERASKLQRVKKNEYTADSNILCPQE